MNTRTHTHAHTTSFIVHLFNAKCTGRIRRKKEGEGLVLGIRFLTIIDETLWILLAQNDRMSIMNREGCGRQLYSPI